MRARRVQIDKDYETFVRWMKARGGEPPRRSWLPKRGWIVDGCAAIFLIKPDCKMAILEFFMSNPAASFETSLAASDLLIIEAERESRKIGMELLIGNSCIPKVISLGLRYGFKSDGKPYYTLSKLLEETQDVRRSGEQCGSTQHANQ